MLSLAEVQVCPNNLYPEISDQYSYTLDVVHNLDDSRVAMTLQYYPYNGDSGDLNTEVFTKSTFDSGSQVLAKTICYQVVGESDLSS